ncbi:MAG: hypothetical protein QOE80_4699 [Actinomycetota bacterium]|nr:hypothetical protein [Actinomycetota bacterium]
MSELEPSGYSAPFAERLRALGLQPVHDLSSGRPPLPGDPSFTTDADFLAPSVAWRASPKP